MKPPTTTLFALSVDSGLPSSVVTPESIPLREILPCRSSKSESGGPSPLSLCTTEPRIRRHEHEDVFDVLQTIGHDVAYLDAGRFFHGPSKSGDGITVTSGAGPPGTRSSPSGNMGTSCADGRSNARAVAPAELHRYRI